MSKKYEFFGGKSLQEAAAQLDHEKQLICQVVATVGSAGEVSGLLDTEIDRVMEAYLRAGSSDMVKLDESSMNADILYCSSMAGENCSDMGDDTVCMSLQTCPSQVTTKGPF